MGHQELNKKGCYVMQEECTCNSLMMADHNAVCYACSNRQVTTKVGIANTIKDNKRAISAEKCTCNSKMMADHNATCGACSGNI